uniref:ResB-like domain-containing protein n=1 Tax=Chlorobium chlorochromatii (strain CaD3) TaxID=340177 RepID=Q3APZ1_CHLCH
MNKNFSITVTNLSFMASSRPWFHHPWQFKESALFTIFLLVAGFGLQFIAQGAPLQAPRLPMNAMLLTLYALLLFGVGLSFRNRPFVQWLGSIPLGLSLIVAIALLSLIGGIVPQEGEMAVAWMAQWGFYHIFTSIPFVLAILLFLANLGIALSWRIIPFSVKNLQFILFHGGFWLTVAGSMAGSSDLTRLVVPLYEGRAGNLGYNREGNATEQLPFAITLHDFSLEEYPPQLLVYNPKTDTMLLERSKSVTQVRKGMEASWNNLHVKVLEYFPSALPTSNGEAVATTSNDGIPFANVAVTTPTGTYTTWLTTGSPTIKPDAAEINGILLIMAPGAPKAFRSGITLEDSNGNKRDAMLEVNKPVDMMGWKLYQMGYDEGAGRWSQLSLVEAIRDPWLPVVYTGFFMMMAANLLFFWNGIKSRN